MGARKSKQKAATYHKDHQVGVRLNDADEKDSALALQHEQERQPHKRVTESGVWYDAAIHRIRTLADLQRQKLGLPIPERAEPALEGVA